MSEPNNDAAVREVDPLLSHSGGEDQEEAGQEEIGVGAADLQGRDSAENIFVRVLAI